MLAWMGLVVVVAVKLFYALRRKGDVAASMSLLKILEFKLDAKEKRTPSSNDTHP